MIFGIYDVGKHGLIDYERLFGDLVEELPLSRKKVVLEAFKHLDTDKDGLLSLNELKQGYAAHRHPDVKKGTKQV